MNELQTFKNELFEVAAKYENNQVLFDVEQVAKSLGITTNVNGSSYVRWNRVNSYLPDGLPQVAKGDFIPEPLVYKLAFKASNELAEQFQDWLATEVIPSIRKHGAYMTEQALEKAVTDPDFMIGLLTNLKEEKYKRIQLENQKKLDEPYTTFGKVVSNSDAVLRVGEFSKMIYNKHGINLGRNKMFDWLREKGFLIKHGSERNNPKQKYIEQGLFETTPTVISRTEKDVEKLTTLITGKGQVKITDLLLKEFKGVTTY